MKINPVLNQRLFLLISTTLFLFWLPAFVWAGIIGPNVNPYHLEERPYHLNERRVALVIGNGAYHDSSFSSLANPRNDAGDMAKVLRNVGFEVIHKNDANRREMRKALRKFGKRIRKGGMGLFYYAGHGIQAEGRNYLIPVDVIDIEEEDEVAGEAVSINLVLSKIKHAGNRLNIVILDTEFTNYFNRESQTTGLAGINAPINTLIAYATKPGKGAMDGEGRNRVHPTKAYLV